MGVCRVKGIPGVLDQVGETRAEEFDMEPAWQQDHSSPCGRLQAPSPFSQGFLRQWPSTFGESVGAHDIIMSGLPEVKRTELFLCQNKGVSYWLVRR